METLVLTITDHNIEYMVENALSLGNSVEGECKTSGQSCKLQVGLCYSVFRLLVLYLTVTALVLSYCSETKYNSAVNPPKLH